MATMNKHKKVNLSKGRKFPGSKSVEKAGSILRLQDHQQLMTESTYDCAEVNRLVTDDELRDWLADGDEIGLLFGGQP